MNCNAIEIEVDLTLFFEFDQSEYTLCFGNKLFQFELNFNLFVLHVDFKQK